MSGELFGSGLNEYVIMFRECNGKPRLTRVWAEDAQAAVDLIRQASTFRIITSVSVVVESWE